MRVTIIALSILISVIISSCKKESSTQNTYPNFSQLSVGNYWIYERYHIDSSGNATALGIFDSCYVDKDTLINSIRYFMVVRPEVPGSIYSDKFVRDSLHYLVNDLGQILFSSQNFTDTFYNYFLLAGPMDTICNVFVKMAEKNHTVSVPAGQFQTTSFKQTFKIYPRWAAQGNSRRIDTRYAENIGIVSETFPFYLTNPNYIQRRLVRYKLN